MHPLLHQFDLRFTTIIQQWPEWVRFFMLSATFVGQPVFTVGFGAVVAVFGLSRANMPLLYSGLVIIATFYTGFLTKLLFQRDRPITDYVLAMHFETFSFPSGHAVGSTVAYGLLAYLVWQWLPQPWSYIVCGLFVLLIVVVGLSRIYLGAHFPSDVIAGWLLGSVGLAVIVFIIQPQI